MSRSPFRPISSFVAAFALAALANAQFTVQSAVGPYNIPPVASGGGGAWQSTLPGANSTVSVPLATPVPNNAQSIGAVTIRAIDHSWVGDLHFVLRSPTGANYNLVVRPGFGGAGFGNDGDLLGLDISIVDPSTPGALFVPTSGDWDAGTYQQDFGAWTNTALVDNVGLSTIPATPGIWTLSIHDWANGDTGTFSSWELSGNAPPPAPVAYCTAGTSTNGCTPSIAASGHPSLSTAQCVITVLGVEGQKVGVILYGLGELVPPATWAVGSTSLLCVKAPTQTMTLRRTTGNAGACDGVIVQDWDAYQLGHPTALGNPFSAGQIVRAQGWYRDSPAPKTTNLSDALRLTYLP